MKPEEAIEQLKAEILQLREQLAARDTLITQLVERLQNLEAQLAQNSQNSSKPPSSDGFLRSPKKRSLRKSSGQAPGGQSGHQGHALAQVEQPDTVIVHLPTTCDNCQHNFTIPDPDLPATATEAGAETDFEPRQVFDLPPLPRRLHITEHRAYSRLCPHCQKRTTARFPDQVTNWVQYGPELRALATYLLTYQLLPYARACELLQELYGVSLSPGTLANLLAECHDRLQEPEQRIKAALTTVPVLHCDETGLYVEGKRQWLHVASTAHLTHYAQHSSRGSKATNDIGILPLYRGTAVHDGWYSYQAYQHSQHALCNAHHLRELTFVQEQLGQEWAGDFKTMLLDLKTEVETAKRAGQGSLSSVRLAHYEKRYQDLITAGLLANPPPPGGWPKGKRGKVKQSKPKNLLDRLEVQREQVLLFGYRFEVPFDNNQAERDIRMVKVQQKVSGCFRSRAGAAYFCRIRGYLSTMKKQGQNLLAVLSGTFVGQPPLPIILA